MRRVYIGKPELDKSEKSEVGNDNCKRVTDDDVRDKGQQQKLRRQQPDKSRADENQRHVEAKKQPLLQYPHEVCFSYGNIHQLIDLTRKKSRRKIRPFSSVW